VSKVRLSLTRWSPPGVRKIAEQKQLGNLRELTPEAAALQQETLDCFACDDVKLANNPEILEADPDERAWAVKLSVQSLSNGMPLSTKNSRAHAVHVVQLKKGKENEWQNAPPPRPYKVCFSNHSVSWQTLESMIITPT